MSTRVLLPLADGFEEIEAVTVIDVLRRADLEVCVAALGAGAAVKGAHGIVLVPDAALADVDPDSFDAIVLPGGMPGTLALMDDERVLEALRNLHGKGRLTAAICAAPMVLARAGLTDGVPVTSHPSVRSKLGSADVREEPRVVRSGHLVTSQGPGTALEFALALVDELVGAEAARGLGDAMCVAP